VKEVLMKLGDGDNKKWKDRKEAMDKVTKRVKLKLKVEVEG
jgi:hypothetical protein